MGIFSMLFGKRDNSKLVKAISEGAFIADVRSVSEFESGSVIGAINIPLSTVGNQLAKFKGKSNIVVFCQSGIRSAQAKNILERNGFSNVINGGSIKNVNNVING